jgi:hypothetical protein
MINALNLGFGIRDRAVADYGYLTLPMLDHGLRQPIAGSIGGESFGSMTSGERDTNVAKSICRVC